MSLAYHNLFQDKLRSTLSIAGVGLAIMLILILIGFLLGVDRVASTYLDHAPSSVVVARKDVKSFMPPVHSFPLVRLTQCARRQGSQR